MTAAERLRQLHKAATRPEWWVADIDHNDFNNESWPVTPRSKSKQKAHADARLIVALRNAAEPIAALIEAAENLRPKLQADGQWDYSASDEQAMNAALDAVTAALGGTS